MRLGHARARSRPGPCAPEVEIAGGPPRRVLKLAPVEEGRALRLLLEPGPEAFQIQATDEVAGRGDLESVRRMADAAGLLLGDMQEPVLRLAYDFITRRGAGGKHSAEPITNFHLRGGGALNALHWDADDSVGGLTWERVGSGGQPREDDFGSTERSCLSSSFSPSSLSPIPLLLRLKLRLRLHILLRRTTTNYD